MVCVIAPARAAPNRRSASARSPVTYPLRNVSPSIPDLHRPIVRCGAGLYAVDRPETSTRPSPLPRGRRVGLCACARVAGATVLATHAPEEKRMRRLGLALAMVLIAVGWPGTPVIAESPTRGGVFRIAAIDAPGLDPHLTVGFITQTYGSLIYSHLVRFPAGPEQTGPEDFRI